MSIFHDKALKGVAEAAAKIMAETSHGSTPKTDKEKSLAALAHPKDKITHKDVLVGRGVLKKEETEQIDEKAGYSAKAARAGKDIGKPGKMFSKIAKSAAEKYGSEERGKKVAGAVLAKLRKEETEMNEDDTGYQDRYAVKDGKAVKHNPARGERDEPHHVWADSPEHAVRKHAAKTAAPMKEEVQQLDEAFPTVADAKKRMDAGKTATGSVTKTATGLVHKRDYKDDDDEDDTPKKKGGYGARQNYKRSTRVNESASFTEMLELYNEHGLKVLAPIETEEMDIDGTKIEVLDADKVNGFVETIVEEPTNDEWTKEYEDQKASFEAKKKQPKIAAGKTVGVKTMPESVEQIDERELTKGEAKKKEDYVMGMKKKLSGFKQRYGERAKSVLYATATSMAKKKS
jgi:hypothetical protein